MKHIVKRAGHNQPYEGKKIYASAYAACIAVRAQTTDAELIANEVCKDLDKWVADKGSVSSGQIAEQVAKSLKLYNSDAAYLYRHHRDIS
ncbi:MAG: ATP cone domain-containing protein [Patescibacteria group bacterium]